MRTDLTPQAVAQWLRARAKKYNEMADLLDQDFASVGLEMARLRRVAATTPANNSPNPEVPTAQALEEAVKAKSGRVDDLAERLGATPAQVQRLLEPASKVYLAERGWLKVRE
jgi:CRP-like cAMP-binding protein